MARFAPPCVRRLPLALSQTTGVPPTSYSMCPASPLWSWARDQADAEAFRWSFAAAGRAGKATHLKSPGVVASWGRARAGARTSVSTRGTSMEVGTRVNAESHSCARSLSNAGQVKPRHTLAGPRRSRGCRETSEAGQLELIVLAPSRNGYTTVSRYLFTTRSSTVAMSVSHSS